MNLTPWFVAWAVLAFAIVVIAIWRGRLASAEDHYLHTVDQESSLVDGQQKVGALIRRLDTWGKSLTVLALTSGAILAAIVLHHAWISRGAV